MIYLQVQVLEGSGPPPDDDLFKAKSLPFIRWYSGNRWKFALSLIISKSDIQLLDHVGLARLPALMPSPLARKYILLIHSIEIWKSPRADYRRAAQKAEILIANSQYTANKARARYPDLPKIKVCWPGKDIVGGRHAGDPKATKIHTPVPLGPHTLLIVGRLAAEQNHKGHDHLLEAIPLILEAVPDAQLVIAGEGNDQKRLEAKADKLNISNQVVFTGWVNEQQLHTLYSQCALFVMPSEGDGFGIVFIEAMMHSKPCVGLKTGAAAEIFENEKSGILIDRNDQSDMANRLSSLLNDETRRRELGEAAYDRYHATFQGRHHSERLQTILMDHLGN